MSRSLHFHAMMWSWYSWYYCYTVSAYWCEFGKTKTCVSKANIKASIISEFQNLIRPLTTGMHQMFQITFKPSCVYLIMIIVNWKLGNKYEWDLNENTTIFIQENEFDNVICRMWAIMSHFQGVGIQSIIIWYQSHVSEDYGLYGSQCLRKVVKLNRSHPSDGTQKKWAQHA